MRTRIRKFAKERLVVRLAATQGMEAELLMGKVDFTTHQAMQPLLSNREGASEQINLATLITAAQEDHGAGQESPQIEGKAKRKAATSPILCFSGPPGVGKTSLGQSISKAAGRKFVRVSLGGVHDEAEMRGHRRTYIGALPGAIIQNLRKVGARNCVMMLDEIDKLGAGGYHGDPAAALLEVLDLEQNATFRDNYLGVPLNLSGVMFVCTANVPDTMPGPLRDRMEIIQLPGYTAQEKQQIARRYLVARKLEATGLDAGKCAIDDAALLAIIEDYTRESAGMISRDGRAAAQAVLRSLSGIGYGSQDNRSPAMRILRHASSSRSVAIA